YPNRDRLLSAWGNFALRAASTPRQGLGRSNRAATGVSPECYQLAARVIRESSRVKPADGVLRSALRARAGLSRQQSGEISRAVFAYYRWFGWLEKAAPVVSQLKQALELRDVFARQPEAFSDAELVERGVPDWVRSEFEVTRAWARSI